MRNLDDESTAAVCGAGFFEDAGHAVGYALNWVNGRIASGMTVPQGRDLDLAIAEAQRMDSTGML